MTQNQIRYQEHLEAKRHNLEMERLTGEKQVEENRHNVVVEGETERSNRSNEDIRRATNFINDQHYRRMDAETQRSNLARERETHRSNVFTEQLKAHQLAEDSRHNRQVEANTAQSNYIQSTNVDYQHQDRDRANDINASKIVFDYSQGQEKLKQSGALNTSAILVNQTQAERNVAETGAVDSRKASNYARAIRDAASTAKIVIDVINNVKGGTSNGKETEQSFWERVATWPTDEEGYYINQ